jgi:three-Cys-motif partner protein
MIDLHDEAYFEREQSAVKQYILREYLLPFALIIGTFSDISYIDCCAGPWQSRAENYADTSFAGAVSSLVTAQRILAESGHVPKVSCLFIEQDNIAYGRLKEFCSAVREFEARPLQGNFTQKMPEIKRFLQEHGKPFPFFFIDPTGWKPIRIPAITPLLQITPGEVLINFMTSHIRRFLSLENLDFDALFGQGHSLEIAGFHGQERDEAAVFAYASEVKKAGRFNYICTTVVPNPLKQQAHFHLIYGTRDWRGVEKFKEAEKRALKFAGHLRSQARERERERRTNQPAFQFDPIGPTEDLQEQYLDMLRTRFLGLANSRVLQEMDSRRRSTYGTLAALYLRRPLVWESDLRELLIKLRSTGVIEIEGATESLRGISHQSSIRKVK